MFNVLVINHSIKEDDGITKHLFAFNTYPEAMCFEHLIVKLAKATEIALETRITMVKRSHMDLIPQPPGEYVGEISSTWKIDTSSIAMDIVTWEYSQTACISSKSPCCNALKTIRNLVRAHVAARNLHKESRKEAIEEPAKSAPVPIAKKRKTDDEDNDNVDDGNDFFGK